MKFAKELEQDLVPEWRAKYLNYKEGKKRVKTVAKAVRAANTTPRSNARSTPGIGAQLTPSIGRASPFFRGNAGSPLRRQNNNDGTGDENVGPTDPLRTSPAPFGSDSRPPSDSSGEQQATATTPMVIPGKKRGNKDNDEPELQYGSIVATPPSAARLELPAPALPSPDPEALRPQTSEPAMLDGGLSRDSRNSVSNSSNAYEVGITTPPPHHRRGFGSLRPGALMTRSTSLSATPSYNNNKPFMKRLFSTAAPVTKQASMMTDVSMKGLHQVRTAQKDFFEWMDKELDKIENFYKEKEDQAGDRLNVLRDQLHEMRNRRIEEIAEAMRSREMQVSNANAGYNPFSGKTQEVTSGLLGQKEINSWIAPIGRALDKAKAKTVGPRPGPNSKALNKMQPSPLLNSQQSQQMNTDPGRDYVRRHHEHDVPYRSAKRKLKLALKEFYRGLELLKSYALLNRTGFRKINKKYDKAVNAHPPLRYMSEKVNKAWFVKSDVLEGHIHAVEDLYARYFERGNHKIAIGKLRTSNKNQGEYTFTAFRSGLMIGIGSVFAAQGLAFRSDIQSGHPDPTIQTQAQYLLQIYAGYFLALYLFSLFCIDCSIWAKNKINYPFIFEFDPRHHLDWRQLAEFPCFLFLLLGMFMWINFSEYAAPAMFIYFPVILIFVTIVIIFIPAPILFHRSRRWFVYSHWRLLLAGLYPVEFRDFFLGDMYCSLTYFTSNIYLFFCLYAHHWNDPPQCNSTHSRLMGFFSALPGIWRLLQCFRRYHDSGDKWPHLYNGAKYTATIVYYVTLSLYRIDNTHALLAIFIASATINSSYCCFWDLVMDWSLCQPHAKKKWLRNVRAFKPTWPYYLAMALDPILRFNWVFYALYTHDIQHSSTASFFVAFSEITRRGMWTIFRVENEHCSNVTRYKASRDIPLPYDLEGSETEDAQTPTQAAQSTSINPNTYQQSPTLSRRRSRTTTSAAEEGEAGSTPRIGAVRTITSIFANAHTKDFEKKRKPGAGDSDNVNNRRADGESVSDEEREHLHGNASSDDDDDDDEDDVINELDVAALTGRIERGEMDPQGVNSP